MINCEKKVVADRNNKCLQPMALYLDELTSRTERSEARIGGDCR